MQYTFILIMIAGSERDGGVVFPCTFDLHNNNNNILNHVNRPVQRYLYTGCPGHCAAKR